MIVTLPSAAVNIAIEAVVEAFGRHKTTDGQPTLSKHSINAAVGGNG